MSGTFNQVKSKAQRCLRAFQPIIRREFGVWIRRAEAEERECALVEDAKRMRVCAHRTLVELANVREQNEKTNRFFVFLLVLSFCLNAGMYLHYSA